MKTRETKQKSIILETLRLDKSHPTIQEIYQNVLQVEPGIGQATVYRNINKLVEEGQVQRLPTLDDTYHYDADCSKHDHLICEKCHKIFDLYENDYQEVTKKIERKYHIKIKKVSILYEGLCEGCNGEV